MKSMKDLKVKKKIATSSLHDLNFRMVISLPLLLNLRFQG